MTADSANPFMETKLPPSQPSVLRTSESTKYIMGNLFKSKLLFVFLGLVVLVEVLIVARHYISKPSDTTIPLGNIQEENQVLPVSVGELGGAKVGLIADRSDYKVGEVVPVTVRVFTGGYFSDGVDLILRYDPKILEASTSAVVSGNTFTNYPDKSVDSARGIIKISAISGVTEGGFNGVGNFATINFKAKAVGSNEVKIDFVDGSTSESNVIKQKDVTDMLTQASGVTINISQNGSSSSQNVSCATRSYQSCVDSQGRSGSYWCTSITDGSSCKVGCFEDENSDKLGCKVVSTN